MQFTHGISSVTGLKFDQPVQIQVSWICTPDGSGLKDLPLYLIVEGLCHHCQHWHTLYKNKKRFNHAYSSQTEIRLALLEPTAGSIQQPQITSSQPLKIIASIDKSGKPAIPDGISITPTVVNEVLACQNGQLGSLWYKHAHKCHPQKDKHEL